MKSYILYINVIHNTRYTQYAACYHPLSLPLFLLSVYLLLNLLVRLHTQVLGVLWANVVHCRHLAHQAVSLSLLHQSTNLQRHFVVWRQYAGLRKHTRCQQGESLGLRASVRVVGFI